MGAMNRRKTIEKRWSAARLWGRRRNRRLKAVKKSQREPFDLRGLLQSVFHASLVAIKIISVCALLAGLGFGGYKGYQRLMASTTFCIKRIEVRGTKRAAEEEI